MRYTLMIAAVALGGLLTPTTADAYWWQGAGLGIGELYRSLDYPTERRVPYFAAHPPVYYSAPVPRTYGHSPFAYGPDARTPEIVPTVAQPVEIINPYVPSSANGTSSSKAPTPRETPSKGRTISSQDGLKVENVGPLMITNPYVSLGSKTI